MRDERHLSTAGFSSSLIDSALKLFKHFPPAMAVRFITRRFIGEYDPTLGRCTGKWKGRANSLAVR